LSEVVHTIKLKEPVQRGEETISELKFKKLNAKMLGKLKLSFEMTFDDLYPVASKATGQPLDVIEKLSVFDALNVVGYLGEALADGQPTGEGPSA
jgi:hypothetical protein